MDGPVVSGAELIRMVDEYGGLYWCIGESQRFFCPPSDGSELTIGTRLIRISASLNKLPRHYVVASPLFLQRGTWSVILQPDAERNNYTLPGLKDSFGTCRPVHVHLICRTHRGKFYKPTLGVRYLLSN